MTLNLWQYCWYVIVICCCILAIHKCGELTEADDRAKAGGGRATTVEKWPWTK